MRKKLLILLGAALLFSPLPALAQFGQVAILTGTVTDSSGAALVGATVTASSESVIGGSRTMTTDANGVYRFPALPPGTYTVAFELSGFKTARREARLQLGQTISVDTTLEVGGVTDTIMVRGSAPTIEVTSSGAQKHLSQEVLEFIPYSSRFGPDAIILAPGVNPNTTSAFGSGGESSNAWMIDGVDVSDPRGGTPVGVCELQLVPGSSVRRPRRPRGIRRLHRARVEQPDPVGRQPLLRAVRNALSEQGHDLRQHQ